MDVEIYLPDRSSPFPLDKNVVGAVFLYKNDNQEMDVELSKWGQELNDNSQYVIQPGDKTGNKKRFNDLGEGTSGVQIIDWQKDRTIFSTYKGLMADTGVATHQICFWEYSGTDNPTDQDMRVKINLWLFKGLAPSGHEDQELVISGFKIQ